ncbi:MAG: MarR family transcriptional regulator [Pseudomonadota bacterium]|nr:MarR family transcriptional regulator [Pseudomonadota bacterium]
MKAKIGIMPEDLIRKRLLAMAQGLYTPAADEPRIWYTSLNAVSQVLCAENVGLLRLIDSEKPQTVTELARLSGRAKGNLSHTLKSLSDKGFVRLEKQAGNALKPVALFTDFEIISSLEIEQRVTEATSEKHVA